VTRLASDMPTTAVLRRLLPYYRPYRRTLALGLLLVAASSAIVGLVPRLLGAGVDGIRSGAPFSGVAWIGAGMVGISLVGGAMRYWMRELLNGVSRWMEYDLRNALFARLVALDPGFYGGMRTGDIMARLTNDLGAVRMAVGPAIMYLTSTIFAAAVSLGFMIAIDGRLTLIALLPMVGLPVAGILLGSRIHDRFEAVQEQFSSLTTLAQENLSGVRVVRAFRQEPAEEARFAALNDRYLEQNMRLARLYGAMHPGFGVLGGMAMVAVLGFGGTLVLRGAISIGDFVAFGMYLAMLTWPLVALGWVINLFQRGAASMRRLLDILDATPAVTFPASPVALPFAGDAAGRQIEFRDVGFHYPAEGSAAPRWILRHVSFVAPAGATIGVVGGTGSGKSTLMDLIPRFHDVTEGMILIDGVDVRDLDLGTLRAEIGYAPQESLLFSDTIQHNLEYGVDDPAAARWGSDIAQLTETIEAFPGRFDTMLGERGINLSGGQKQRGAMARALARRPNILLLDDALSAVDTHTEAEILTGMRSALAGRTALIASHRVSAIRDATWIIVLDDGRVVEQGRHDALMAAGGRYTALLSRQALEEAIEDPDSEMAASAPER
jgi:ATP-binding cassette subfamily B multidrug efflux pump